MATALVWYHNDLRVADHPALYHAAHTYDAVVPVFVWAPEEAGAWPPGGAQAWWLHHSLPALDADLRAHGLRLVVRRGPTLEALRALLAETGAEAVFWNKRYAPALRRRDLDVAQALRAEGVAFQAFESRLLHDPDLIQTGSGGFYRVFTPFWKKLRAELEVAAPLPPPRLGASRAPARWPDSLPVEALGLSPQARDGVDWADGLRATWTPGEAAAHRRLERFVAHGLLGYGEARDRPAEDGSSRLSPYLHHGALSPRQVWHAVNAWVRNGAMRRAADAFLRQLAWREFSYHLLYHRPDTPTAPLKAAFSAFPWRDDAEALRRWQRGQTGYPLVDAGMRQLWQTGWMHNRVRLLVASFLTKDLLLPWQEGARWFWDTLVDADLANNTMGWQWSAGSGADAQPFFRIFNPTTQGARYDPGGAYVRRWVPELARVPIRYLHRPWTAPAAVLAEAGVHLGDTYPIPLVDHQAARARALAAFATVK